MKKAFLTLIAVAAVLLLPLLISRLRFPGLIKSATSRDGRHVASLCYTPSSPVGVGGWVSLWPTATRIFAVVSVKHESHPVVWAPLDLSNDLPEDYATSEIVWNEHRVTFSSNRGVKITVDTLLWTIERKIETKPNKAMEPIPVNVTIPADAGLAPLTYMAHL